MSPPKRIPALILSALLLWLAVRYLLPLLLPFLLGAGLALGAEPAVRFLEKRLKLPRSAASGIGVSALFTLVCTLLMLLFTLLFRELGMLARILPDMEVTAQQGMNALRLWITGLAQRCPDSIRSLLQRNVEQFFSGSSELLDKMTQSALGFAGTILSGLPDSALSIGTGVLSAFLISAKLPAIRTWFQSKIPQAQIHSLAAGMRHLRQTAGLWFAAQLKLTGITYLFLALGFLLLRISYAPLWALAVAAVDAFPILGTGTILVPWSVVCILHSDPRRAMGLLGLYLLVSLTRSVLEPRFVGRELGLDPLVTLIAIYAGFKLWGFLGMILMPLAAMTLVQVAKDQTD